MKGKKLVKIAATVGLLYSATILSSPVFASEHKASADQKTTQISSPSDKTKNKETKAPREIGVLTRGSMDVSGTGASGLHLQGNNQVTTGNINLHYVGTSILSVGVDEQTETVFSVPNELKEVVSSPNFTDYVNGTFQFNGGTVHTYDKNDIRVEDGGKTIRMINPTVSWFAAAKFDVNLNIDLGQLVTDTGIRIPDATNNSSYEFLGGLVKKGQPIDWDVVGNYNTAYTLPTHQLDPGWNLINEKPTVETVYDTDTTVTGKGTPGAEVQIKVGDKVIGEGKVDDNGIYKIDIPKQNEGVTLSVSQNTGVGWSEDVTTIVKHKEADIPAPSINEPVTSSDTSISGTGYTVGDTIIVTDRNGKELGRGLVNADKTFTVNIPKQDAYTILHVVETNGNETSPVTEVTVHEGQTSDGKITGLDNYSLTNNDGYIHGTYSGASASQVSVTVDGTTDVTVPLVPGNGKFQYYIADRVSTPNQTVIVNLQDKDGKILDSKTLNIVS